MLEQLERFGGSLLFATGDSTEFSLRDHPNGKDKAEEISINVDSGSSGYHEAALRLSGRDGMSVFNGIESYKAAAENASVSLFAPTVEGHPQPETELQLEPNGSSYLEFGVAY